MKKTTRTSSKAPPSVVNKSERSSVTVEIQPFPMKPFAEFVLKKVKGDLTLLEVLLPAKRKLLKEEVIWSLACLGEDDLTIPESSKSFSRDELISVIKGIVMDGIRSDQIDGIDKIKRLASFGEIDFLSVFVQSTSNIDQLKGNPFFVAVPYSRVISVLCGSPFMLRYEEAVGILGGARSPECLVDIGELMGRIHGNPITATVSEKIHVFLRNRFSCPQDAFAFFDKARRGKINRSEWVSCLMNELIGFGDVGAVFDEIIGSRKAGMRPGDLSLFWWGIKPATIPCDKHIQMVSEWGSTLVRILPNWRNLLFSAGTVSEFIDKFAVPAFIGDCLNGSSLPGLISSELTSLLGDCVEEAAMILGRCSGAEGAVFWRAKLSALRAIKGNIDHQCSGQVYDEFEKMRKIVISRVSAKISQIRCNWVHQPVETSRAIIDRALKSLIVPSLKANERLFSQNDWVLPLPWGHFGGQGRELVTARKGANVKDGIFEFFTKQYFLADLHAAVELASIDWASGMRVSKILGFWDFLHLREYPEISEWVELFHIPNVIPPLSVLRDICQKVLYFQESAESRGFVPGWVDPVDLFIHKNDEKFIVHRFFLERQPGSGGLLLSRFLRKLIFGIHPQSPEIGSPCLPQLSLSQELKISHFFGISSFANILHVELPTSDKIILSAIAGCPIGSIARQFFTTEMDVSVRNDFLSCCRRGRISMIENMLGISDKEILTLAERAIEGCEFCNEWINVASKLVRSLRLSPPGVAALIVKFVRKVASSRTDWGEMRPLVVSLVDISMFFHGPAADAASILGDVLEQILIGSVEGRWVESAIEECRDIFVQQDTLVVSKKVLAHKSVDDLIVKLKRGGKEGIEFFEEVGLWGWAASQLSIPTAPTANKENMKKNHSATKTSSTEPIGVEGFITLLSACFRICEELSIPIPDGLIYSATLPIALARLENGDLLTRLVGSGGGGVVGAELLTRLILKNDHNISSIRKVGVIGLYSKRIGEIIKSDIVASTVYED